MSFYDDASLVVIPSGYKTSKVYAEKPTDGSGDLAFTRTGDTATRVNSAGLIEKVRTNLVLQSNTFSNASWAKITDGTYSVVTENITDAFGNTSAVFKVTLLTGSFLVLRQTLASATTQTTNFSLYVKKTIASSYVGIDINDNTDAVAAANTSWQRISNTRATASFVDITTYSLNEPFYIFASQVELGDIATDYIPTTTAAVSVGPVANVPRLDYLGSTCPRLLLEPQRTNLVTYSEQFNNAAWSKNQSTISSNSATSPDGNMSADKLVEDSSNAFHDINQLPFSTTGGQTYTFSIFVKPDTRSKIRIGYGALVNFDAFGGDVFAIIDVSNKSVISSVLSPTILFSDFENGYVRVTFLKQATGSGQFNLIFGLVNNSNAASYLGDGSSGLFIWGAQVEGSNSSYPTSYIPTLAASATRGADACSKTGISSLIGQTEGTVFVEIYPEEFINGSYIGISDNANIANRIIFGFEGGSANSGTLQVYGASGLTGSGTYTRGQRIKVAIGYKSGSSALYVNGNLVNAVTSTFTTTLTKFGFDSYAGTQNFGGRCSQALLFKTRLTNAELATLTTL